MLSRAIVSSKYSKHMCIIRSTIKLEFIALDKIIKETE